MYDLCKFIDDPREGILHSIWNDSEVEYEKCNWPYPFLELYKFYSWEEIARGYCWAGPKLRELYWGEDHYKEYHYDSDQEDVIKEGLEWCKLINRDQKLLLKIMPEIIDKKELIEKYNLKL